MSVNSSSSSNSTVDDDATVELSPNPPLAPNWNDNLERTILSLAPYQLFPSAPDTLEYATIAALLAPFKVRTVEQIVNPMLWSRFTNTRKQMLLSKSDDCKLLPRLSSDHTKIFHQMHIASAFEQQPEVAAYPYNDNVALLFHCTRDKKNIDTILVQGLDERLGAGGLLGKGIYFASDPLKSMGYDGCGGTIFIFAVLLGDCLSVSQTDAQLFVREPTKTRAQQRTSGDINFDSIVGQPGAGGACEYVVYNRYQCCPMYKIKYNPKSGGTGGVVNGHYSKSKNSLPPFKWQSSKNHSIAYPPSTSCNDWPLFAKNIFAQMGVVQVEEMDVDEDMTPEVKVEESAESIDEKMTKLASLGFENNEMTLGILKQHSYDLDKTIDVLLQANAELDESDILINNKLATLTCWGFNDAQLNSVILKKNSYDLNKCVRELLELGDTAGGTYDATQTSPTANGTGSKQIQKSKFKDCEICSVEIDTSSTNWKVLRCGHQMCEQCYRETGTTRTTMTGVQHTFMKCPFCAKTSGIEIGICPDGTMTTSIVATPCEGYNEFQSIQILYAIQYSGYEFNMTAYLPNNEDGNELLRLLQIAFDRRICFTIRTSATNDQKTVLAWNIQHKTAQNGGLTIHSFPDATFMDRCKGELSAFGIK